MTSGGEYYIWGSVTLPAVSSGAGREGGRDPESLFPGKEVETVCTG